MDVGRLKIGKTLIFLICDAPPPLVVADVCTPATIAKWIARRRRRRRMRRRRPQSSSKSPQTSGGCSPRSTDLWHQIFLLTSKPLWVWWSTEDRDFAIFDFFQIDSTSRILYSRTDIFFDFFSKRCREVSWRLSVGRNLGRLSVGRNFEKISANLIKMG